MYQKRRKRKAALNGIGEENRENQVCETVEQHLQIKNTVLCPTVHALQIFYPVQKKPAFCITYMSGHST